MIEKLKSVIQLLVAFQMLSLITRDDTANFSFSRFVLKFPTNWLFENVSHKQNYNFNDPLSNVLSLCAVV